MGFAFDGHVLDLERRELRRGSDVVRLEPQAFDLLTYLVRHRERVVSRDELIQAIWGGRIITESALATRVNVVRRAIGDDGRTQRLIRTLSRRGFRFIGDATDTFERIERAPPTAAEVFNGVSSRETPTIAVLPFLPITEDPESQIVGACITEEIATSLIQIPWLSVVDRGLAISYASGIGDLRRVGRDLGVHYLITGSVRRERHRLRIAIQLAHAETRTYVWSERLEGTLRNTFELQDAIAASVTGAIEPTLEAMEAQRSLQQRSGDLTTAELYFRGLRSCYAYDVMPLLKGQELLDQAIQREPDNAPALAVAAGCRQFLDCTGWTETDRATNQAEAVELAHRALQANGKDPRVLGEAARVLIYFTGDIDTAIPMIERALAYNGNHARNWYWSGWIRLMAGYPDDAVNHFKTSSRLSPDRRPHLTGLGVAHFLGGRYMAAVGALTASLHEQPRWPTTYRFLAAAYAHAGQLDMARQTVRRLRSVTRDTAAPVNRSQASPFQDPRQAALYLDGLALASSG